VVERIVRNGADIDPKMDTVLMAGDDIVIASHTAAIVAARPLIGKEIDADEILRAIPGNVVEVLVTDRQLHGRSLQEVADRVGTNARGVFLRTLTRVGRGVPLSPETRIYVGDVMTLVGSTRNIDGAASKVGQVLGSGDRTDIAFLAAGVAFGLLAGLVSVKFGSIALTLGGGGGALVAGLVCGWYRSRQPTVGALPPAAQQILIDIGLGGFIAAIGLGNGQAAWAAIQAHGALLVGMGIVVEYANRSGKAQWIAPPPFRWSYARFAKPGASAPSPDETFEMVFAKDNAAEDGFNRWTINEVAYPMSNQIAPASFHLKQGKRYRLRVRNASDDIHPVHLHRHSFELTNLAGTPTGGVIKDIVMLGGYQQLEIDFVANNPGLTLFHCHQQLHMDFGFMTLFDYA